MKGILGLGFLRDERGMMGQDSMRVGFFLFLLVGMFVFVGLLCYLGGGW